MALFVIYGVENSGKTHAAWLIYHLLNNQGRQVLFEPAGLTPLTHDEVIQHIKDSHAKIKPIYIPNFRAIFEYNGKRIALFSAGDYLEYNTPGWEVVSFKDCMNWAIQNDVDHIICCARYNNTTGGVHNYLLNNYKLHIYRWYLKKSTSNLNEQIAEAQRIAIEVFTDIKANV